MGCCLPDMTSEEWEGAASELLAATCTSVPVDMFSLAAACGFKLRPGRTGVCIEKRVLYLDTRVREVRQQGLIAHEIGHFALDRSNLPQSEMGARYVAGALRLPRTQFIRDLRETQWSIESLGRLHPYASAMAIAVRITQVRHAAATVIDPRDRVRPWRITSESADTTARPLSRLEVELAAEAWQAGVELRSHRCIATPLPDASEPRVIVVCDLDS